MLPNARRGLVWVRVVRKGAERHRHLHVGTSGVRQWEVAASHIDRQLLAHAILGRASPGALLPAIVRSGQGNAGGNAEVKIVEIGTIDD